VVFCLDRGGLVGADGATHHGAYDLSFLRCIPNMVVMAPKDENELRRMMRTAIERRNGPTAIRYPRGNAVGVELEDPVVPIEIGEGEVLREGDDVAIFAIGKMVEQAVDIAERLAASSVSAAVINARFAKPVDHRLIARFARDVGAIVTLEENVMHGGFGSAVAESLSSQGISDTRLRIIGLPDRYIDSGTVPELWQEHGLDATSITETIQSWLAPRSAARSAASGH